MSKKASAVDPRAAKMAELRASVTARAQGPQQTVSSLRFNPESVAELEAALLKANPDAQVNEAAIKNGGTATVGGPAVLFALVTKRGPNKGSVTAYWSGKLVVAGAFSLDGSGL